MCGINGFTFSDQDLIKKMMVYTKNRGPDANGIYHDTDLTMSHDRLSIIDLNERSNQPMKFKNYIISFNGEIYNYKELKKDLELNGRKFNTNSDTEVILQLFDEHGTKAFEKLSGIFAISIWDTLTKSLYLIRDTLGVKPLYYFEKKKKIFYSSSIKALLLSVQNKELNHNAINFYTNFGRNDDCETIFKGIFKLLPGELLIWNKNKFSKKKILNINLSNKNKNDNDLKIIIDRSINSQLVSDVPLGLSLSGGVDSNIVYSVMRKNIQKFNIYSFYFKDYEKFNEDFRIAKVNAEYYKNNFIPIEIGHIDYIENAEKVVDILEEPSGNHCSILNYTMSKQISEKILMTGDG